MPKQFKSNYLRSFTLSALSALCCSSLINLSLFANNNNDNSYLSAIKNFAMLSSGNTNNNRDVKSAADNNRITLAPMLKKAMPSVVNIKIFNKQKYIKLIQEQQKNRQFNNNVLIPENGIVGMGSGVIIDSKNGIIVTNNHVINDAESILITLHDGRKVNAKLLGTDPDSDLAVLKIDLDNLSALPLADSDQTETGDFVLAIGSPFGLNQTVTSGIISGKGRVIGLEGYEDFIQTDASINPGNSGGALINLKGELIGINTAILAPDGGSVGIGFAIPSNMTSSVLEQLIKFGKVRRGLLGVVVQALTPDLADAFGLSNQQGALVDTIARDSVAYNSDLKVGDIITKVNSKTIKNASDLKNTIGLIPIGADFTMDVIRDKKPTKIKLSLLDPKDIKTRAQRIYPSLAGVYIDSVTNINIPHMEPINGLKLLDVIVDSPAWQQGLRPNDIIIGANHQKTTNLDELEKAIKNKEKPLLLRIVREHTSYYMALKKLG